MTRRREPVFGPLGRRLLAAFTAVAACSVLVLTGAALVGTDRGLAAADRATRQHAAEQAAAAAAGAYRAAGGWAGADLAAARAVAEAAGAQLVVRDAGGTMVWPGRAPPGSGPGHGNRSGTDAFVTATVVVDGRPAGTAILTFGVAASPAGRRVAWEWVIGAAVVALLLALATSWYVARRLALPLHAMTRAARAFAAGDRAARASTGAPGELGTLSAALDAMADQVVRADQVRRQLSADIAHELRTPLAALQAGLEELRDGLAEPRPARLAALHDQSLRLGRIVDDLGQLSAAEAAALSLRPVATDLADIVTATLAAHQPRLHDAGLQLTRDIRPPVPVHADPDRLHQAVANLLSNAERYCRPGDRIRVQARVRDGYAQLQIADSGPGIDPADLPHVFDRLWRGRNSRGIAGSGIGLAVVRELVTAQHGTVTATGTPGGGATFTIRLPLARPATTRAAPGTTPAE